MEARGKRVIDVKPNTIRVGTGLRPLDAQPMPAPTLTSEVDAARGGLAVNDLSAWYGSFQAIRGVSLLVKPKAITALIGPSGSGKSTFLRCLNRMHEVVPGARATGEVLFDGRNILDPSVDPVLVRRRIGMVFQRPNPFPTKS